MYSMLRDDTPPQTHRILLGISAAHTLKSDYRRIDTIEI